MMFETFVFLYESAIDYAKSNKHQEIVDLLPQFKQN